jgi:hypothetical protein
MLSGVAALFDVDKERGAATRKRIYDLVGREQLLVMDDHTSFPSVAYIQKAPAGYR